MCGFHQARDREYSVRYMSNQSPDVGAGSRENGTNLKHFRLAYVHLTRRNLYVSSDGFSMEVLGRTGLRYREAGREMFVDSEVLTDRLRWRLTNIRYKTEIDRSTISWSWIQIATEFSTTFAMPFTSKASRSMSYELTRNSRVSNDLAVL